MPKPRRLLMLAVLAAVAVVVISNVAFAGSDAAAPRAAAHGMAGHDMGVHEAALEDELAQVRRVTARFHDLDAALEAGYELGWVNGSGVRIITGCVFHPTAGGWATTTSTRA
jgi:hypothetical protein